MPHVIQRIIIILLVLLPTAGYAEKIYLLAMNANMADLKYTGNDREHIISSFQAIYNPNKLSVYPINNVTPQKYAEGINWLQQVVTRNDHVIIYFSGHGTRIPDREGEELDGYDEAWVGYNKTGQVTMSSVIKDDRLAENIKGLKPRQLTVILDTCFSGGMQKNLQALQGTEKFMRFPVKKAAKAIKKNRTIVFHDEGVKGMNNGVRGVLFAASAEAESAIEFDRTNLQGGIFTLYFTEALRATRNIEQAFKQARQRVMQKTKGRQTPQRYTYH